MPDAYEVQLADAVTSELNDPARAWSQTVAAERLWLPAFKAEELVELKVSVVPLALDTSRLTRDSRLCKYGVAIDFQKMVDPRDKPTIDALTRLVEEVHDFYANGHHLATMADWAAAEADRQDVYGLQQMDEHNTFESLVLVTLRGKR